MSAAVAELVPSAMRKQYAVWWVRLERVGRPPLRDQPWKGEHSYGENATSPTVCCILPYLGSFNQSSPHVATENVEGARSLIPNQREISGHRFRTK